MTRASTATTAMSLAASSTRSRSGPDLARAIAAVTCRAATKPAEEPAANAAVPGHGWADEQFFPRRVVNV
ncbi:MAG TPA: hypothetical protein H9830_15725 [Candidatus Agrococcus pullicola]|uniref:Uncharacterized protein n=1 Tax=Candidatus Agrococcus pullicola TaxID=2838429 RepID=A0A9D2CBP9_9MICO|nr:hypothetical protein [Candidatus Agrococcus pullicola]